MRSYLLALAGLLSLTALAHADTTLYSNIANGSISSFTGYTLNGGAAKIGSTTYTKLLADDIHVASGTAGMPVNQFTFSVANLNSTAVHVDVIFQVFALNSSGNGPGSLLFSYDFADLGYNAGSGNLTTAAAVSSLFTAPSDFYTGIIFSDGGRGDLTTDQLNNIGMLYFGGPTVGSSANTYFASSGADSGVSNPSGSLQTGNSGNLGFEFKNTLASTVTPEPSSLALLGTGMLGVVGVIRKRLR